MALIVNWPFNLFVRYLEKTNKKTSFGKLHVLWFFKSQVALPQNYPIPEYLQRGYLVTLLTECSTTYNRTLAICSGHGFNGCEIFRNRKYWMEQFYLDRILPCVRSVNSWRKMRLFNGVLKFYTIVNILLFEYDPKARNHRALKFTQLR
jgi:hypothetical protein